MTDLVLKPLFVFLLVLGCFGLQALEYEVIAENDAVSVARAKIEPHEEIGLHRDVYPQVVVALQGGTVTRLEADGSKVDVVFPTGQVVFRDTDPPDVLHRTVNTTSEPIELVIIHLKAGQIPASH